MTYRFMKMKCCILTICSNGGGGGQVMFLAAQGGGHCIKFCQEGGIKNLDNG